MKNLFLFAAALVLVGAGCTAAPEPAPEASGLEETSVAMQVPAADSQDAQEMVVENEPGDEAGVMGDHDPNFLTPEQTEVFENGLPDVNQ